MKVISQSAKTPRFPSQDKLKPFYPRAEMSNILTSYNESIGNDQTALKQAARLAEEGSVCVFTGQQLGLLGGPIYTILKGISCVIEARKLGAIPIFWLATEDHDSAEIDHTHLIDALGNLKKYQVHFPKDGHFVEDLVLTEKHIEVISHFFADLNLEQPVQFNSGDTYARSMARLLAYLFRGTGLLFIEPYLLRDYSIPLIEKELVEADTIFQRVGSIFDFEHGTNIFYKNDRGRRCKIVKETDGYHLDGKLYSLEQILLLLHQDPERFSTNVAARPVLQSLLFPTVAYVAGPNEIIYFNKLREHFHFHQVPMPTLIPRLQATFVTPEIADYLNKCGLKPWDSIPSHWAQLFPDLTDAEKEERRQFLHQKNLPTDALHKVHNMIMPKNKLQERILSWWQFYSEHLVKELITRTGDTEHIYIYL